MNGVSVIIPAFNAEEFIEEALKSVFSQTCVPDEVIVVDDGSIDNTKKKVSLFSEVQYLYQKNEGTAQAINAGVKVAKGQWFAFLDADDLWLPDKLEKQLKVMKTDNTIDMVFTLMSNFLSRNIDPTLTARLAFNSQPMPGIHKSTMIIRRDAFFKVGLFSPYSRIDLLDWYARSKEMKLKEVIIDEVLVHRRIHNTNQSITNHTIKQEFPKALKAVLDRRRSNG